MNHLNKFRVPTMKPQRVFACIALIGIVLSASCGKESFQAAYFSFIDDEKGTFAKELQVPADGGVKTFTLVSNRTWSIDYEKAPWITVSPLSGSGVATITFTFTPNESLDEDYITLSVVNNTLTVISGFKVTRQNYLGEYKGKASIYSPLSEVCTTCVPGEETAVTSSAVYEYDEENEKFTLKFTSTVKLNDKNFVFELPFEGNMRMITDNNGAKFTFDSAGTYDMTALGTALGDTSIEGEKSTVISGTLSNGKFTATVLIDPGANNTVDAGKTTVFTFEGSK